MRSGAGRFDYSSVTEVPGTRITAEALAMARVRYALAASHGAGRDVLEVACGGGQGLHLLARHARRLIAGDVTDALLRCAVAASGAAVPIVRFDAHRLPFAAESFDLVLLFEALYYLARPGEVLAECRRVLRPRGTLIVCSVNPAWRDFNPSPYSTAYLDGPALCRLLRDAGFRAQMLAAFPSDQAGVRGRTRSALKRFAVRWRLMPRTMTGKRLLKHVFLSPLVSAPMRVDADPAVLAHLVPLPADDRASRFKVIYAVGALA